MKKVVSAITFASITIPVSILGGALDDAQLDEQIYKPQDAPSSNFFSDAQKYGIEFSPTFYGSSGWNLSGGRKITTDGNLEYLIDVNLKLHSDKILHYEGGELCVDVQFKRGGFPNNDAGSFQYLTYIQAPNLFQLAQLWYMQSFDEDKYWIKIGKNDCSMNFDNSLYASNFQYQSFQPVPTIKNLPYYPNPAMGVVAYASPVSCFSLALGLFDGSGVLGVQTGSKGVFGEFFNHLWDHAFLIAEADFSWKKNRKYSGRIGVGAWHNTSNVPKYSGGFSRGIKGAYLLADQTIWRGDDKDDPRLIGVFLQTGFTSPQTSPVKQLYATGLNWVGMFPGRENDEFGFGVCMNRFSLEPGSGFIKPTETVLETFYIYYPLPWINIQPDLQYIITPGGGGVPNALVFLLNTILAF